MYKLVQPLIHKRIYQFCNIPKVSTIMGDHTASYTIDEKVTGTYQGNSGVYMLMFTCAPCGNKMARTFTKDAYHKGVVLIRCDSCNEIHLIADNLGWFEDDKWNVETDQASKGKLLPKVNNEEVSAIIRQFLQNK